MDWAELEDGYGVVHRSVLQMKGLPKGAKLVYALLASYSNGNGEAWPTQATIAADLEVTEKPVREWVADLVERGMITQRKEGYPARCIYRVRFPVRERTPASVREPTPVTTGTVLPLKKTNEEDQKKNMSSPRKAQTKLEAVLGTGLVRKITDYYQSLYSEEFPGFKPTWDGKTIKLVKADIARMGDERLGELIQLFFEEPPSFVTKNETGLGYNSFHGQIDSLIMKMSRRERKGA